MRNNPSGVLLILVWAMLIAGCAGPITPRPGSRKQYTADLGRFEPMPRARIGSLPFPGPFTLYAEADPQALGHHSYSGHTPRGATKEVDRGIVYTRRAGFLDICHIRNAADMTAYLHARVHLALSEGWAQMRFKGKEPSVYTVSFEYPQAWGTMTAPERELLIDELSITIAQRLAFDVMTWHEIITWYGYKSTVVISEQGSAFTYDDTPSHVVGIDLAGRALRGPGGYDDEMTALLNERLDEYDAVDRDTLGKAQERVKHEWWTALGGAKVRLLDFGDDDGIVEPLVIDELLGGEPAELRIPQMGGIAGRDMSGFYRVEIDPRILEGFTVRGKLKGDPKRIVPERDFPILMADIAHSLEQPVPVPGDDPAVVVEKKP